ncbi:MAG: Holliday junction branch migration protein RuvA [Pirellulaceae bacterium]|nr:Holliday junction branch migration protein RuvA [Pirellulaceae bacterium]
MIARLEGMLLDVEESVALVRCEGGLTYEVSLPAYAAARLGGAIGQPITLHTLYFIEGQAQGTTMTPRLAGFVSTDDRRFFELFTTCKGIGNRRALRSMTLETARIAAAIADRDVSLLQSLPEVGKRTAETIVATLHGKVDAFVSAAAYRRNSDRVDDAPTDVINSSSLAREALEVLLQLGENRIQSINWIDQALRDGGKPVDTQDLLQRVYRIKAGG